MCRMRVIVARCGTLTGFVLSVIDITPGWRSPKAVLPRAMIFNAFSVDSSQGDDARGCDDALLNVRTEEMNVRRVLGVRVS